MKPAFRHRGDVSVGCLERDFGGKFSYVPRHTPYEAVSEKEQKNLKKKCLTFLRVSNQKGWSAQRSWRFRTQLKGHYQ